MYVYINMYTYVLILSIPAPSLPQKKMLLLRFFVVPVRGRYCLPKTKNKKIAFWIF